MKPKIHLIEDDPDQRQLRGMLLEAKGYTVVEVHDSPDLVLMDLRIPTLADGLAKIRALRNSEESPKVVVLSGAVEELRGREEGAMVDAILEKPCSTGLLFRTLEALLLLLLFAMTGLGQPADLKRHAPILYQRADTIGTQSDIPLLMYVEWDANENSLTYTVIFSNEDGGTSTRALMARWGRTTDIEYLYKVWLKPDGSAARREIQTRDHKDVPFNGPFEGDRPLLVPVTRNNMVDAVTEKKGERYDFDPMLVDLRDHSREYVMDLKPETWKVMREELAREGKLRPYGTIRGEDISDPANYAYMEFKSTQRDGGRVAFGIQLRGAEKPMYMSHLGDTRLSVERSGWMRLALELPPNTKLFSVTQVGVACYGKGSCLLEKIAFLELGGQRGQVALPHPVEIKAGEQWFFTLK
ncbi:response regulator transcription factor [Bryobacter aggregatus]|uniref:response regulator transcription factor n=1 Tax=Bryobacter aggregatus TaxID=360054 RepID=UPI0009B5A0A0|nr:response regulator [Bryobacter aggregatus]